MGKLLATIKGGVKTIYNMMPANYPASRITGTLSIDNGGTGAGTASSARTNLGLGDSAVKTVANNLTTTSDGYVLDARQGKALLDKINTWSSKGICYNGSSSVQLDTSLATTLFIYAVSGSNYYHATEIFPTGFLTSNFRNQSEGMLLYGLRVHLVDGRKYGLLYLPQVYYLYIIVVHLQAHGLHLLLYIRNKLNRVIKLWMNKNHKIKETKLWH